MIALIVQQYIQLFRTNQLILGDCYNNSVGACQSVINAFCGGLVKMFSGDVLPGF